MQTQLSSDGETLRLVFSEQERAELKAQHEEDPVSEADLLERWLANSEFQNIDPSDCGDLTDAPMFGILGEPASEKLSLDMIKVGQALGRRHYATMDVSVTYNPVLARWGYMSYQLRSMVEDAIDPGVIVLTGHVAKYALPGLLAQYGMRYRIETPDGTQFAAYSMQGGPYLTGNSALAYCWDIKSEADQQLPLYEAALKCQLGVRSYQRGFVVNYDQKS